jgi:hypothetical protein
MDMCTTEELLVAVFSMHSVPKLYQEDEWVLRRKAPPLVEEGTAFSNI